MGKQLRFLLLFEDEMYLICMYGISGDLMQ